MENSETQVWLNFAYECKYLPKEEFEECISLSEEIGKLLHDMMKYPEKYK